MMGSKYIIVDNKQVPPFLVARVVNLECISYFVLLLNIYSIFKVKLTQAIKRHQILNVKLKCKMKINTPEG